MTAKNEGANNKGRIEACLRGAWGFADLEERVSIEMDSAMQIGSISKMMTAAAIGGLAHESRRSLES